MDNSNSLSSAILKTNPSSISNSSVAPSSIIGDSSISTSSTGSSGIFDSIRNINVTTWIIIVLILTFLGFNIFVYLAKGTESIKNIFNPLIQAIFGSIGNLSSQVVDVSAEGGKAITSGTAGVVNTGLTDVQNITPGGLNAQSSLPSQSVQTSVPSQDALQNSTLNKALNTSQQVSNQGQNEDYEAHEAQSSVTGKAGWCYIGEDRGYRTCAQVGVNDVCMSGDIFPSNEICINPNLRA